MQAVEHVLGGGKHEDDVVELKADWPDVKSFPRRLAGAANRAAGTEIILIVGIDEDNHRVVELGDDIDPETWWSQVRSGFDELEAPDPTIHKIVHVRDGQTVVAFAFRTDGAPYVVKNLTGKGPEREVPIRTATGTGWAHRSDLIRMLARRVHTPNVVPLADSHLNFTWYAEKNPADGKRRDEYTSVYASLFVFVEHLASDFVMFPQHAMTVSLDAGGRIIPLKVRPPHRPMKGAQVPPASLHGIEARDDGLLVTGPGRAHIECIASIPAAVVSREDIEQLEGAVVNLALPVTGSDVPARLTLSFRRVKPADAGDAFHATLGNFVLTPS